MDAHQFIYTLQIADAFFPVGAFAYSDGLETAAIDGHLRDGAGLDDWLSSFIEDVFIPCEGLALLKCLLALESGDFGIVQAIDEELTAIRPAAATRAASTGVGKSLLATYVSLCEDESFSEKCRALPRGNAAAAYALVFFHRRIAAREALLTFGYSRLSGIVSAALRLISIGQRQGQTILTKAIRRLPEAVERTLEMKDNALTSFNPILDIHQMNHQYVYSRLFRS